MGVQSEAIHSSASRPQAPNASKKHISPAGTLRGESSNRQQTHEKCLPAWSCQQPHASAAPRRADVQRTSAAFPTARGSDLRAPSKWSASE
ncbi:unnamed protein product [Lampetra planeri]